jgi:hypothetical protein
MSVETKKLLLVGDNPFHGISHLSDERARARGAEINRSDYAAKLVQTSLENGAEGFMFSVSQTTLSTLRILRETMNGKPPRLYAIIPYAYEYVRLATHLGTVGLAKEVAKQIVFSGNISAFGAGLKWIVAMNPNDLLKAYLLYEVSRIKSVTNNKFKLESILLHEVITEMILSLDLDWLAKSYIKYVSNLGSKPGFETRNFAYLVNKFQEWDIDFKEITIATAFNGVGFQMNPSKNDCEKALASIPESNVIAMSVLASGYLNLPEAAKYMNSLFNLKGVVVGVSKEKHASETFRFLRENLQ